MATEKKYLEVGTGDCDPCSCYYTRSIYGRFACQTAGLGEDAPYGTITRYDFWGDWTETTCCESNTENEYGDIQGDDELCHAGDERHSYSLDDDCYDPDPCACLKTIKSFDMVNLGACDCDCAPNCWVAGGQVHLKWSSTSTGPPTPWPTELGGEIVTDPNDLWEYFLHNHFPQEPQVPMNCNSLCDDDDGGIVIEKPVKGHEVMKSNNAIQTELAKRAKADKTTDPMAIIKMVGRSRQTSGAKQTTQKEPTRTPFNGPWKMRDTDKTVKQYYKDDVVTWAGKTYKVIQDERGKHPSNNPSFFLLIEDKNAPIDGGLFN